MGNDLESGGSKDPEIDEAAREFNEKMSGKQEPPLGAHSGAIDETVKPNIDVPVSRRLSAEEIMRTEGARTENVNRQIGEYNASEQRMDDLQRELTRLKTEVKPLSERARSTKGLEPEDDTRYTSLLTAINQVVEEGNRLNSSNAEAYKLIKQYHTGNVGERNNRVFSSI